MQKIGKSWSSVTQIENVSTNHLMAQIHFVLKYTMYTMKMVPGSKEFVCLENVMMMFLALLLEIFAYPGQYLGRPMYLWSNLCHFSMSSSSIASKTNRFIGCVTHKKYVPLMNLFRLEANCSLQYCQRLSRLWCSSRMQSSPWWHLRQNWHWIQRMVYSCCMRSLFRLSRYWWCL